MVKWFTNLICQRISQVTESVDMLFEYAKRSTPEDTIAVDPPTFAGCVHEFGSRVAWLAFRFVCSLMETVAFVLLELGWT